MIWLIDGTNPLPNWPAREAQQRNLSTSDAVDVTYDKIIAMENSTFTHECFVALIEGNIFTNFTPYPVVWCDINVPLGLNITAEIRDGTCDQFTDPASSDYFTKGVASPVLVPEVSEDEKRMGVFDHSYCAGMDILYDVNGTGNAISVVRRRFAMEAIFWYEEKEEIVNKETGETDVEEVLTSVQLVDENTKTKDRKMELGIGLGVLAGAMVTIALIAIIYGKKRIVSRRRWEAYQRELEMGDEQHEIEIARINAMGGGTTPSVADTTASVDDENEII